MTAAPTLVGHEWRLVAPWWHWPRLDGAPAPGPTGERRAVRLTGPVFQKYDGPELVNTFLADPQRRLAFVDDSDRVATVSGNGFGTLPTRVVDGPRKLYLASHHRHYLVVCSLHCDVGGFPHARRDDVCEAGFVVRRRTADLPGGSDGPAAQALRRWATARRKRIGVEQRLRAAAGPLRRTALERRLAALAGTEAAARGAVREQAAAATGPVRALHGWVPDGTSTGAWVSVDEQPVELTEAAYPLSPLVPDPTRPDHDAAGQTIYFGVVPTGSSDVDGHGAARFDDGKEYEIRCYTRRHRPDCPRDGRHCTCPLTWSEPTECYRLAGHFDLEGCANRPVTVQLPDIRQLHADALRLGPGGAGGVRFRSPPNSQLSFTADDMKVTKAPKALNGPEQICSFAIPLITIVAFFVLQLFLPIVVLVFQLWFLLALRFCLPPDVEIDAGLAADFELLGAGLDIDAGVAVTITNRPSFREKLKALLGDAKPQGQALDAVLTAPGALSAPSLAAIGRAALAQKEAPALASPFADRVRRSEVVMP